jgi:putative endonuclease
MRFWVYMLRCADGLYYVGSHRGEDVANRVSEHQAGLHREVFTFRRRPVELVWCDEFPLALQAIAFERQFKGWSRAKKEALIRGDFESLPALSRRRASPRPSTSSG